MIKPFKVAIAQPAIDDLHNRIRNTRWTDEITGSGWTFGAGKAYMKELVDYWVNQYNWAATENEINKYDNYIATIDGYTIHFMHIKGRGKKAVPLILTHGWPSTFLEMYKMIPLLTSNDEFSFDLVIPSLMGFGFSQKIDHPGCNVFFMAELWVKLMQELGYEKFGLQGGDFGAGVSTAIAIRYPERVIGLHLNYIPGNYHPVLADGDVFTEEEILYMKSEDDWHEREGGYSHQQGTKPLTLAYGLNDSPVGLAAWIIEKMYGWAECRGNIENVFTKDELLSNVSIYWFTETIHSSIRLYNENRKSPMHLGRDAFITTPVGIARFRFEEPFPPRKFIERGFNIRHWTEFDDGGHFAAMEQPALLAQDIYRFFKGIS